MWNEAQQVERYGSGGTSIAMPSERRSRSSELHDALQAAEKNAEALRVLASEIAERLLGPVPSQVDKAAENGGVGIIGESVTILRTIDRSQRDALAALQRIRGDL